jgi:hypothetical protein
MDIHLKKLTEIRKTAMAKKQEETKRVEDVLQKSHNNKVRTYEFLKQGKGDWARLAKLISYRTRA